MNWGEYAWIKWLMGWNWWVGMILHMEHDWMVGWILTWDLVCMINLCLVGETWLWYGLGRNFMNLLVRSHGGASCKGRNSMNLLVRSHGGASCKGRNSTNLLVRSHGGASFNGRNSMTLLVRAHGGASDGRNSTNS